MVVAAIKSFVCQDPAVGCASGVTKSSEITAYVVGFLAVALAVAGYLTGTGDVITHMVLGSVGLAAIIAGMIARCKRPEAKQPEIQAQ